MIESRNENLNLVKAIPKDISTKKIVAQVKRNVVFSRNNGVLTSKNKNNTETLQKIYDFNFRQLELSIREIGYGDQSINKKMKDYINLFHSMVSEIHFWDSLDKSEKLKKFSIFLSDFDNINDLLDYFEDFNEKLSKKTLNSFLKSVSNP